jgi:hypothetical protein
MVAAGWTGLVAAPVAGGQESDVTLLPGSSGPSVVADLDRDGSRELVRIASAGAPADGVIDLAVEVWRYTQGGWALAAATPLERSTPAGPRAVRPSDALGLLTWVDGGSDRAMVIAGAQPTSQDPSVVSVCCVELREILLRGNAIDLVAIEGFQGTADWIAAADMDADGTDELVVSSAPGPGGLPEVTILTLVGRRASEAGSLEVGSGPYSAYPALVGDSDGVPGEDVLFGPFDHGEIVRMALTSTGEMLVEHGRGPRTTFDLFAEVHDGEIYTQSDTAVTTWRWPRGEQPRLSPRPLDAQASMVGLLTAGEHAAVLTADFAGDGWTAATRVTRPDGTAPVVDVVPSRAAASLMEVLESITPTTDMRRPPYPYHGSLPRLPDGGAAYLAFGKLIVLEPTGEVRVRDSGALAGAYPVGFVGPDDAWLALSAGFPGEARFAPLFGGSFSAGPLAIARFDSVVAPEPESPAVITFADAPAAEWNGADHTFVDESGLGVSVNAPPNATVLAAVSSLVVVHELLPDGRTSFFLDPPRASHRDRRYDGAVIVVTPTGHAYVETRGFVVIRNPPRVEASAETRAGELAATVSGEASHRATVVVDGTEVPTDATGAFEVDVAATPWPRDIRVVARDPLGNEDVAVLTVIGLFDYRTLPWVPITAVGTGLLGVALFLRAPRGSRPAERSDDDDGELEELAADGRPQRGPDADAVESTLAVGRERDERVEGTRIRE